ncbi:MAG: NADase-type glycan-binding domain-containing protein [Nitriliruptoraceae bacterium]
MPDDPDAAEPGCPDCGATIRPPGRFCTGCGRRLRAHDGTSRDHDEAPLRDELTADEQPTARRDDVPPASGWSATRRCPGCGAVNVHHRVLCWRCGIDLDGEDGATVAPLASQTFTGGPSGAPVATRRGVRWLWPAVAGLLAIAGVIAALVLGEVGPFEPGPTPLERLAFPAESYGEDDAALELASVAALTTRESSGDRSFGPQTMVDGDLTTAWHGDGEQLPAETGEKVDVLLEEPAWVAGLVLANGDHRDSEHYAAAGRLQRAELRFDGGHAIQVTLLDLGRELQYVEFDEPVLTTAVRIAVEEVVAGAERDDPAISELELRGYPADEDDAALAEQRAEELPAAGEITINGSSPRLRLPVGAGSLVGEQHHGVTGQ